MEIKKDKIRAFIAIKLPDEIVAAIRKVQDQIKSSGVKIRWVRPENIHLTLKFLGDINERDIDQIHTAMIDAVKGYSPISLSGKGVGVFPNLRRPKVMWVGLGGESGRLIQLQETLDSQLKKIGFSKEKRAFKGHLTMGRVKGRIDTKKLTATLQEMSEFESEPFSAGEIVLFQSDLRPSGAVYIRRKGSGLHNCT